MEAGLSHHNITNKKNACIVAKQAFYNFVKYSARKIIEDGYIRSESSHCPDLRYEEEE